MNENNVQDILVIYIMKYMHVCPLAIIHTYVCSYVSSYMYAYGIASVHSPLSNKRLLEFLVVNYW